MDALHATASATAPPVGDTGAPFEVRTTATGRGLFACRMIASGTRLFGEDDWTDEDERRSFSFLSAAQLNNLTPTMRTAFLRYAYNTAPEQIAGTFRSEGV